MEKRWNHTRQTGECHSRQAEKRISCGVPTDKTRSGTALASACLVPVEITCRERGQ